MVGREWRLVAEAQSLAPLQDTNLILTMACAMSDRDVSIFCETDRSLDDIFEGALCIPWTELSGATMLGERHIGSVRL
jgi:hypothetical protein